MDNGEGDGMKWKSISISDSALLRVRKIQNLEQAKLLEKNSEKKFSISDVMHLLSDIYERGGYYEKENNRV